MNPVERCAGVKQTIGSKDGNMREVEKTTRLDKVPFR
jgi:hypothetical protein